MCGGCINERLASGFDDFDENKQWKTSKTIIASLEALLFIFVRFGFSVLLGRMCLRFLRFI